MRTIVSHIRQLQKLLALIRSLLPRSNHPLCIRLIAIIVGRLTYRGRQHTRRRQVPLFRSAARRAGMLTDKPMNRVDAWRMVQRRSAHFGIRIKIGCHVFRATGVAAYLEAGTILEDAQAWPHTKARAPRSYMTALVMRLCSMRSNGSLFRRLLN